MGGGWRGVWRGDVMILGEGLMWDGERVVALEQK